MDKMGMEIIRERKQILIEEEASGTKGAAGKDLLTLLIRANVRDKDGMSDEAVLARECRSFCVLRAGGEVNRFTRSFRNTDFPYCRARDDECRSQLDLVWVEREFGGSEEAQGGALDAQHRFADDG